MTSFEFWNTKGVMTGTMKNLQKSIPAAIKSLEQEMTLSEIDAAFPCALRRIALSHHSTCPSLRFVFMRLSCPGNYGLRKTPAELLSQGTSMIR